MSQPNNCDFSVHSWMHCLIPVNTLQYTHIRTDIK